MGLLRSTPAKLLVQIMEVSLGLGDQRTPLFPCLCLMLITLAACLGFGVFCPAPSCFLWKTRYEFALNFQVLDLTFSLIVFRSWTLLSHFFFLCVFELHSRGGGDAVSTEGVATCHVGDSNHLLSELFWAAMGPSPPPLATLLVSSYIKMCLWKEYPKIPQEKKNQQGCYHNHLSHPIISTTG